MTAIATQPLVTVGVPVLNGADLLERSLRSIVGQTYRNLEIVVSDNASTDATPAIVEAFAKQDPRFHCFRQSPFIPGVMNFRFVLEHGTGKYFFWAPHDDWWDERFVERGVAALEQNSAAAGIMGTVRYYDTNDREVLRYDPPYPLSDPDLYRRVKKYLTSVVTDHVYYGMFRRAALLDTIWTGSPNPDKVVIMHALLKGPILDGFGMEYHNRYIPRDPEALARAFSLPSYARKYQVLCLTDILKEIWRWAPWVDALKLSPVYFLSQQWHKFFAKWLLESLGIQRDRR